MSQRENERATRSLGGKPAAVWECSPYISLSPPSPSLPLSLFPVHLHCCETELNKVKEKVKQADRRSSLPTCHSSWMGRCSSIKGSKTQIVCRDADWGKTRLAQPDSTRLLSPSLEERVIFCSLSASSFPHYPSHLPLCSLASPVFCVPCFTVSSLLFCHLFPACKSCLCLLFITFRHFCPLQLHLPAPVPLCLRLSLLPARRPREGHLRVRDGGGLMQLYTAASLNNWERMDGWMDDKSRSRKDRWFGVGISRSPACWWGESVQRFARSLPHVKPSAHLFCHLFSLAIHHDGHPLKLI